MDQESSSEGFRAISEEGPSGSPGVPGRTSTGGMQYGGPRVEICSTGEKLPCNFNGISHVWAYHLKGLSLRNHSREISARGNAGLFTYWQ